MGWSWCTCFDCLVSLTVAVDVICAPLVFTFAEFQPALMTKLGSSDLTFMALVLLLLVTPVQVPPGFSILPLLLCLLSHLHRALLFARVGIAQFGLGKTFYSAAWRGLKHRYSVPPPTLPDALQYSLTSRLLRCVCLPLARSSANMSLLVALGTSAAYAVHRFLDQPRFWCCLRASDLRRPLSLLRCIPTTRSRLLAATVRPAGRAASGLAPAPRARRV